MELSNEIMQYLRQRRWLEQNDTSQDDEIKEMSKQEVFEEVLIWNGMIGYGSTITNWIEEIFGVKLED